MIEKLPTKRARQLRPKAVAPAPVLCFECLRPQGAHSSLELRRCRKALEARIDNEGVTPAP